MNVLTTELEGVLIFEPRHFPDDRGFFMETYNAIRYDQAGLTETFTQDNHSQSTRGVIRGLHYQLEHPQGKFLYVVRGEIFDVAVDIRQGSPTFGHWTGIHLSADNKRQFYIPTGFAHGFSVLSEHADVIYKCTNVYHPGDEYGVHYADSALKIDWKVDTPAVSEKDLLLPTLDQIPSEHLPIYDG